MNGLEVVEVAFLVIVFAFSLAKVLKFLLDVLISLGEDGVLFHPGYKLYSPKVLLLVKDMKDNPEKYLVDEFHLTSKLIQIWIASGWTFYKDKHPFSLQVGPFSIFDRFLLEKSLKPFYERTKKKGTTDIEFEIALRKQNGIL